MLLLLVVMLLLLRSPPPPSSFRPIFSSRPLMSASRIVASKELATSDARFVTEAPPALRNAKLLQSRWITLKKLTYTDPNGKEVQLLAR